MYIFFVEIILRLISFSFFFFNDTATTEIYTLSLHDALPIYLRHVAGDHRFGVEAQPGQEHLHLLAGSVLRFVERSEEHTSELQSLAYLVCRLLLEKKKNRKCYELRSPNHSEHFVCVYNMRIR